VGFESTAAEDRPYRMNDDPVLGELGALLQDQSVRSRLDSTLDRVEAAVAARDGQPQAWEALPLALFGSALPSAIRSAWVFVLRGAAVFGAERHPNSHQRTLALRGSAVFEVFQDDAWSPRTIVAAGGAPGENRLSIPANTWHRIRVGSENFVSCSFHTVPAAELLEETPVDGDLSVTRRRLYHA
jgi:hypothetical protein